MMFEGKAIYCYIYNQYWYLNLLGPSKMHFSVCNTNPVKDIFCAFPV